MFYVRYSYKDGVSISAVCDISFDYSTRRIEFVPMCDYINDFYIPNCSSLDFDTISGALRSSHFINLEALGYRALID